MTTESIDAYETYMARIDAILEWAEDHEKFDTTFVTSLKQQLVKKKMLSPRQIAALANVETWVGG